MQTDKRRAFTIADRLAAAVLALVALVVYLVTLSPGAYPGASASLIVSYTGLIPPISPVHPLWSAVARFVGGIPVGGGLAERCNALSAVFGASCVGLMYIVVVRALALFVEKGSRTVFKTWLAIRLAGVFAALFLAFCAPFWIASTRAHTATFDAALLLGATWPLLTFLAHRSFWLLYLFAFVYGVGMVESATFVSLAPLYGVAVLYALHWLEALQGRRIQALVGSTIGGLLLYFVVALVFYKSASYELYGYESYFKIVWYMLLNQYGLLMHSLPRVGWMVILLLTIVPWLVAVLVARKGLNEENDWSLCILHVIVTVLAIVVILNLKFSPWDLAGPQRQLVSPYVLVASLAGYLVAYWFLFPSQWHLEPEQRLKIRIRAIGGPLLACPMMVLLLVAPFLNAGKVDTRDARPVNAYAREVLKSAAGYKWLVTDGLLDSHLRILAHDMGSGTDLLNLRMGSDERYMRYTAERIGEPRLKSLAQIGFSVFLEEWLETTPDIEKKLAVFGPSGIWDGVGLKEVPNGPVLIGHRTADSINLDMALGKTRNLVERIVPSLQETGGTPHVRYVARRLIAYTGLMANNIGVLLQDLERPADAFDAYALARQVSPNNASALLNQVAMLEDGFETPQADAVRADIEKLKAGNRKYDILRLSRTHGNVRTPMAAAQLGIALAMSGRGDVAVRDLSKAIAAADGADNSILQQTLVAIYLSGGELEKGEELCREILSREPSNILALESMARLSMRRGAFDEAKDYLERARKAGLGEEAVAVGNTAILLLQGDTVAARTALDEAINKYPEALRLLGMRAAMADSVGDEGLFAQCLNRMRGLPNGDGHAALIAGRSVLRKGDTSSARRHFERALSARVATEKVLRTLLELDLRERNSPLAERHARRLLAINPRDAFAFYVLGSVQLDRGDFELAEASLRTSIRLRKTPLALNDLSWLLERAGKFEEAETLAREAVAMAEDVPSFLDTLGVALMRTGRYAEAEAALRKAVALDSSLPATDLHMAELQVLRGNLDEARVFLRKAENARQGLSQDNREKLGVIRRRLRELATPR